MLQTALHDLHIKMGGSMVDFAGWHMPVKFAGIIEEHHHTRNGCSVFDVSHMGRLKLTGKDVLALLDRLCTRKLADMAVGQSRYSHMCKEDGGILDDLIVSRYENYWGVVCNASNREKIVGWIGRHIGNADVALEDQTLQTAMLAIQGPRTMEYAAQLLPFDISGLKRYWFLHGVQSGIGYTIARSGYTGEDGVEIIIGSGVAKMVAIKLFDFKVNGETVIKPAGLGARDTLRTEAAMPLYGHELTEEVDSLTAGQGWCVALDKDFIGVEPMRRLKAGGLPRKLVGLELDSRRIARQGYSILSAERTVGTITSGTLSPTLNKSIAMGFVQTAFADEGRKLDIDISGGRIEATIVKLPFYKRA